jgi:O-antigen/teichoic acid export membrane protein
LGVVLFGTAVLAAGGALSLCLIGPWVIKLVYSADYVRVASAVLPWYAWAMVPLALANVLINNLLARTEFRIVPVLLLLATGYGVALTQFHDSLITARVCGSRGAPNPGRG